LPVLGAAGLPLTADDGACDADEEDDGEPAVGSAAAVGESADDELGTDGPLAAAASDSELPPPEHPAKARTTAATTTSPRIAPPLTPDTAMLAAARRQGVGIGHPG